QAIRATGARCDHTLVLFYYDIFEGSTEKLKEAGLTLHYLATWRDVLAEARAGGHFDKPTLDAVGEFLADPIGWSKAAGGA
ncbi:MAG: orotate phosphoribosyltransferase, partial [Pikeienuella sp.]